MGSPSCTRGRLMPSRVECASNIENVSPSAVNVPCSRISVRRLALCCGDVSPFATTMADSLLGVGESGRNLSLDESRSCCAAQDNGSSNRNTNTRIARCFLGTLLGNWTSTIRPLDTLRCGAEIFQNQYAENHLPSGTKYLSRRSAAGVAHPFTLVGKRRGRHTPQPFVRMNWRRSIPFRRKLPSNSNSSKQNQPITNRRWMISSDPSLRSP